MKLLVGINKITIDEKSKLNAGEYNIHEVEFEFDEVYNGLITKAVFEGNGHSYLIDIVNNKCTIPYEVLSEKGDITIGAYGYNIDGNDLVLRYSPSPIYTYVDLGSYRDSYDNYQQPTADIIEQLTNRIETAESQINEALEEVEEYNDRITTNTNNIDDLDNNKVDKIEGKGLSSNDYTNEEKTKLEGIETNAEVNIIEDIKVNNTSQSINNKSVNISIPTKTSDITNDSGFIDNSVNNLMNYTKSSDLATVATSGSYNDLSNKPTIPDVSSFITKDVNNLTNYTLKTDTGSLIDLEINNTTYVVTLSLKDIDGNVISTDTIDLPLENVVVSGRYDNNTKKVILTLENGSEVDFSVADLVADLQTEITSTNKLASDLVDDSNSGNKFTNTSEKATWNAKYDKPISGIPKSDLTNDVQSSLNLADSALQSFTETDPIFSNSASAGITSNDISKWNNKQDTLIAGANITIDNDGKTISATDTTYNDATTSTSGLMSASDKTKLNGIETEANKTIVDNAFNSSSTNPLQNKVITDFIGTNATVSDSGTEFNLSNCLNKPLKDFKGYGDTEQDIPVLPNSYTQVDYIESTGTQYINTGYIPTIYDTIETTFSTKESTTDTNLYGSRISGSNQDFTIWINTSQNKGIAVHSPISENQTKDTSWIYTSNIIDVPTILKITPKNVYVNGNVLYTFTDTRTEYTGTKNAYLFAQNQNNNVGNIGKFKVYSFKIWNNSTLIRNFIPCYRNSDNAVGLYDIVNNVFYTNSGTGAFTYGTTSNFPQPYYPVSIDAVTGRQVVEFNSKNLLNTPYNENNKLSITSTKDDYVTITDYYAYLEANKTYTFSCESDGEAGTTTGSDTIEIFLLKDKGYDKYYFQHNAKTFTFLNTVAGNYYIRLDVNKNNVTHKFWNFYIAEENSFSGYKPYQHEEHEINLVLIKLYENEYIYKSNENWYIHRLYGEYTFTGNESWSLSQTLTNTYRFVVDNQNEFTNIYPNRVPLCNKFVGYSSNTTIGAIDDNGIAPRDTGYGFTIKILKTIVSDLATFKTWLSSNNVKVIYQLANPYEEQITNTELINQLNAIQPILGDNIITVNSNNELVMSVDIEAYTNTLSGKLEYLLDNV